MPVLNEELVQPVIDALLKDCGPEQIISIFWYADSRSIYSLNEKEQWLRISSVLANPLIYENLYINSLPIEPPATFFFSHGMEVIGTLANLLDRGGIHYSFTLDWRESLKIATDLFGKLTCGNYRGLTCYSSHEGWCDWFCNDNQIDETLLVEYQQRWWLLMVTGTD